MKCLISFLPVLFILLIGCVEKPPDHAKILEAAEELDQKFFDAYNSKDLDGMLALYWNSPDVISLPPGEMMLKGYDNLKSSFEQDFSQGGDYKLEVIEHNNRVEGSVVIGTGLWRFTMNIPDSDPFVIEGRYLDIKAERNGKWVYLADHASVPLPPPPGN
jgi:ketosteroid isomerase-like protein